MYYLEKAVRSNGLGAGWDRMTSIITEVKHKNFDNGPDGKRDKGGLARVHL